MPYWHFGVIPSEYIAFCSVYVSRLDLHELSSCLIHLIKMHFVCQVYTRDMMLWPQSINHIHHLVLTFSKKQTLRCIKMFSNLLKVNTLGDRRSESPRSETREESPWRIKREFELTRLRGEFISRSQSHCVLRDSHNGKKSSFLWQGAIYVGDAMLEEPRPAVHWPYCWWLKCLSGFIDLCRSVSALRFSIRSTLFQERHLVVKHGRCNSWWWHERKYKQLITQEDFTVFDWKHGNVFRLWVGGALRNIKVMTAEFHLAASVSHWLTGTLESKRASVDVIKSDTCFFLLQKEWQANSPLFLVNDF